MAILRRLATHSRRMQKIGLSDLSKILYNATCTSPLAMDKIKMGVQAKVSELGAPNMPGVQIVAHSPCTLSSIGQK